MKGLSSLSECLLILPSARLCSGLSGQSEQKWQSPRTKSLHSRGENGSADTTSPGCSPPLCPARAVLGSADCLWLPEPPAGQPCSWNQPGPQTRATWKSGHECPRSSPLLMAWGGGIKASASRLSAGKLWEAFRVLARGPGGIKTLPSRG